MRVRGGSAIAATAGDRPDAAAMPRSATGVLRTALETALPPTVLLLLALPPLIRQPLWYDEVATLDASRRSWPDLWHLLQHTDAVFSGYYALMHLWLQVGASDWWLRLPSLLATLGSVVMVGRIGRVLLGRAQGAAAATLFAVNPLVVSYSHDARPYALATLGVTAAAAQLIGTTDHRPAARRWASWAAAGVVAHLFAVLCLLPQLALMRDRGLRWRRYAGGPAAVATVIAASALGQRGQVGWLPRSTWYTAVTGWTTLSGGAWAAVPAAAGLAAVLRRSVGAAPPWREVVTWALFPLALLVTVSAVTPLYLPRYVIESTPAVTVLTVVGLRQVAGARVLARGGTHALAWTTSLVAAISCAVSIGAALRPYRYENLPSAADYIRDTSQVGDGLVYLGDTTRLALHDAVAGPAEDQDDGPVPVDVLLNSGIDPLRRGDLTGVSLPAAQVPGALERADRLWVASWSGEGTLASDDATSQEAELQLRTRWRAVCAQSFGSLRLTLWEPQT